jgi:hypothetical protein
MSAGSSHAAGERAALAALDRPLTAREKAQTFGPPYYRVRITTICVEDIVLTAHEREDAEAMARLTWHGQGRFTPASFEPVDCRIHEVTATRPPS